MTRSPQQEAQGRLTNRGRLARRGFTRRGWMAAGGAGVVLALVGIGATVGMAGASAQPERGSGAKQKAGGGGAGAARTSDVYEVARSDFEITTTATGELRARNQIEIRNTLDSDTTITEIVAEGTSVKAGDLLVKLNAENIQTKLDEESLDLESSRAAVVEAEQSYEIQVSENESAKRAADLKLTLARLDLEQWKQGEVESKRQELDHALERAEKDELRLREKLEKSKALYGKGYYSLDQLKQDELAHEQAAAALAKAELDKDIFWDFQYPKDKKKKESDVDEAVAELERVQRQNASKLASKEADRANKRQALTIREQKFQKYQQQVAAATIKAPSDGLVVYASSMEMGGWGGGSEGPLQVGSKVFPNQGLIILPDTSEMVAAVRVHESLAGRIRPGQSATVRVDAAGERRFTGTIDSIGILAEQTSRWMDPNLREYTVKIILDLPKDGGSTGEGEKVAARGMTTHGLKPSMRCESEIFLGKVNDAVTAPIQAVFTDGLVRYVHLVESGGRIVRRPVQVGQRSDRFAEIRAGLEPGERVLIRKPEPAEVTARPWDAAELAKVGLALNDQGQVIAAGGGGPGGGAGMGGSRGKPGGPGGTGGAGGAGGAGLPPAGGPAQAPSAAGATGQAKPAPGAGTGASAAAPSGS